MSCDSNGLLFELLFIDGVNYFCVTFGTDSEKAKFIVDQQIVLIINVRICMSVANYVKNVYSECGCF